MEKEYTVEQVYAKINMAIRFLDDSKTPINDHVKYDDLHGAAACLGAAYNMLSDIKKTCLSQLKTYSKRSQLMKIFRRENLIIHPSKDQTVEDIRNIIEKTQDLTIESVLTVSNYDPAKPAMVFDLTVRRSLESYPDTIK